ncbi:non-specific lipid-transfer protein 1-like [Solanum verrucosum]|uniref:non-specific lipid-transfer protein 1-like n=1 Tax=Solanum verrucosum TaxID=315347 RepID=UPI0020D0E244|nr:non-specific lipid-transfer protein 1-like [Solanum verrucosum]
MPNKQLFSLLLICIAVATAASIAAEDATVVTCSTVYSSLEPCLGYVLGGGLSVPSECCSGIKSLHRAAHTTADRQRFCRCLKNVRSNATETRISRASKLTGICKVNAFFKIRPDFDCSKVK